LLTPQWYPSPLLKCSLKPVQRLTVLHCTLLNQPLAKLLLQWFSTAAAAALACKQQQLSRKEPGAEDTSGGQSSKQTGGKVLQAVAAIGNRPVGIAACLPKLDKHLSHRSSEDLTARAVAKLWGVDLKRYTGRNS